jgi:hypothetical protein
LLIPALFTLASIKSINEAFARFQSLHAVNRPLSQRMNKTFTSSTDRFFEACGEPG